EFVFRMFSTGTAALPAGGIQAIPRQLAEPLPAEAIRLNTRVVAVDASGAVTTEAGETLQAQAVVVATEAPAAAQLLGAAAKITPLDAKATTCLYYAADRPPVQDPVLMLSGDGRGPVNNVSVLTNVAPSYGPPGQALLSVVVLGETEADDASLDRAVRTQLTGWFGPEVGTWRHLRTYRVRYALPDQAPPFLTPLERPIRLAERLFVCGDHRQTASLNGALVSGRHAGEMVAALMATGP
ncbi:MAG: FAD-dependent oxidoreductase, partial [Bacteroidota bacterium]